MPDAVAFAAGAALCAMLGSMQLRADRTAGHASGYLLLWALGFIWTFGNFLRGTLALAGVGPDTFAAKATETFAWSCTLLGPIAIGRLAQAGIGATSQASKAFVAFTVAVAFVNLTLLLRAGLGHDWNVEETDYPAISFYVALGVGAIALVLYLRGRASRPARATPRWFAPAAFAFAAIHTSAILLSMLFPGMPGWLMTTCSLIGRHWTIPWSILLAVSLAQAHYADEVLKRSLWLLFSVATASVVAVWLVGPLPGMPRLATILAMSALMLVSPFLIRALERIVDQAILARPNYIHASRKLELAFRGAARPEELIESALDSLRATLHVEARWVESTRRLEVSVSHGARTLLQQERVFLDAVQLQLDHRLESMRLEAEQRALLLREERLKRLLTEAELKALRTQVDPHFLFNTLNTIAELISSNPQQAERMTERLAECFRYALAKHSRDLSTLDEELDFARQYLEIEQVRFGDRLRVRLSRGDAMGSEAVPSLLLQPLLENAIRHGLAPVREGGCVSVHAHREGERLHLSIEDDGVGLRADSRSGIGLQNVQERLRTLYAQAAEFLIGGRPEGRGTRITIIIPLAVPLHVH